MTKFPEAYTTAVKREHLNEHKKSPVGHVLKPESPAPPSLPATKSSAAYTVQVESEGSKGGLAAKSGESIAVQKSKTASKNDLSDEKDQYSDDFHESDTADPSDHYADDFEAHAPVPIAV